MSAGDTPSKGNGSDGGEPDHAAAEGRPQQVRLPSGAVLNEEGQSQSEKGKPKSGVTRGKVLAGAGVGVLAVAAAGWLGWASGHRSAQSTQLDTSGTPTLPLVYGADVCEAPMFVAYEKGFFEDQGLHVVLKKTGTSEDTQAAVGSGKYVGSPGIFFAWLKPIEQGQDVKLAVGLHQGCLRLVVNKNSGITKVAQLRGKKIGVSGLQSSALNFFSLDLLDAGIVPNPEAKQVEWVVIDNNLLPQALKDGRIDAIAASDPIALLPTLKTDGAWARELTNNRMGPNAQEFCCATALNGKLVREHPDLARKLVTAWAQGSLWAGANPQETAEIEISKKYVAGTSVDTVSRILQTYRFAPSASRLKAALVPGIKKFANTGFLDKNTNPQALADKVFVDLGLNW